MNVMRTRTHLFQFQIAFSLEQKQMQMATQLWLINQLLTKLLFLTAAAMIAEQIKIHTQLFLMFPTLISTQIKSFFQILIKVADASYWKRSVHILSEETYSKTHTLKMRKCGIQLEYTVKKKSILLLWL